MRHWLLAVGVQLLVLVVIFHYELGAVVQLHPETLEIVARVPVGVYPDRLALRAP
jgi:hypothetical protein